MKAKVLLIAEIEIGRPANARDAVETVLDNFRESVLPSEEHNITLYQATADDLAEFSESGKLLPTPGILLEGGALQSTEGGENVHRYPTTCPSCKADLTRPESVELVYTIGDDQVHETTSRLDENGRLVDVGGVVAKGYHSDTVCGGCLVSLAEHELFDVSG